MLLPPLPANPSGEKALDEAFQLLVDQMSIQPEISCKALKREELLSLQPGPLNTLMASIGKQVGGADVVILMKVSVFETLRELDLILFNADGEILGCVWDHGYKGPNGGRFDRVSRDNLDLRNAVEFLVANVLKTLDYPSQARTLVAIEPFDDSVSPGDYAEALPAMLATCMSESRACRALAAPGPLAQRWGGPLAEALAAAGRDASMRVRGKIRFAGEIPTLEVSLEQPGKEPTSIEQAIRSPEELRLLVQQVSKALFSGGSARLLWSFKAGASISGAPVYCDGDVYFTAGDEHLYAVSLATGELNQKVLVEHSAHGIGRIALAGPVLFGGELIILAETGNLHAYSPKALKPVWHASVAGSDPKILAVTPEGLLVLHGDNITLLDEKGKSRWCIQTGGSVPGIGWAEDLFFYGSADQRFHAASLHDGKDVWAVDVDDRPCGVPAVDGETIFFGTDDGLLHAVRRSDGQQVWVTPLEDSVLRAPLARGHLLLAAASSGRLYGLDRDSGKIQWQRDLGVRGTPLLEPMGARILASLPNASLEVWLGFQDPPVWSFTMKARARFPPLLLGKEQISEIDDLEIADRDWILTGDDSGQVYVLDAGGP